MSKKSVFMVCVMEIIHEGGVVRLFVEQAEEAEAHGTPSARGRTDRGILSTTLPADRANCSRGPALDPAFREKIAKA
jgi:hypothetical protein